MADAALLRASPLGAEAPLSITLLPPACRLSARGGPEAARRIGAAFGPALSADPMRANADGPRAALWLGPDEWLLLAPEDEGLAAQIESALAGEPGCVVDVSHRQSAFTIAGEGAAAALGAGCPLDLDVSAFPVGMVTRTVLAKADIVLWRQGPGTFHVECWRSFAPYVHAFLHQAAADL